MKTNYARHFLKLSGWPPENTMRELVLTPSTQRTRGGLCSLSEGSRGLDENSFCLAVERWNRKSHLWEDRRLRRAVPSLYRWYGAFRWAVCFTLSWAHLGNDHVTRIPTLVQISKERAGRGRGREAKAAMQGSDWQKPGQNCWLILRLVLQSDLIKLWLGQVLVANLLVCKEKMT